jgi:hypothetical protein
MKVRILSTALIVAVAASGCVKNDQKPVNNSAAIKAILIGSWTGSTSNMAYYDAAGNKAGSINSPLVNLKFDTRLALQKQSQEAAPLRSASCHRGCNDYDQWSNRHLLQYRTNKVL